MRRRRAKGDFNGEPRANRDLVSIWHQKVATLDRMLDACTAHGWERVQDTVAPRKNCDVTHLKVVHLARLTNHVNACNTNRLRARFAVGGGDGG